MCAKVLILEDDLSVLRLLETLLSKAGHSVTTATNGQSGLEKVGQTTFELVVADISMPRMRGDEFLRRLRDLNFQMPVLLVTGLCPSTLERPAPGSSYLMKPFAPQTFLKRVEAALHPAQRLAVS